MTIEEILFNKISKEWEGLFLAKAKGYKALPYVDNVEKMMVLFIKTSFVRRCKKLLLKK